MSKENNTSGNKAAKPKKRGIRVANRQAWVDTFVYLCPQHRGGMGIGEYCRHFDGTRTNCTGRCTYNGGGSCEWVTQFFKTYIKFVEGELKFL